MPAPFKSDSLKKQLDSISVPKDVPVAKEKTSDDLIKELPNVVKTRPVAPWKSNGDPRRDLLIKKIDADLEQKIAADQQRFSDHTNEIRFETYIKAGEAAINAYDRTKAKFTEQHDKRYAILNSLPQHSAAYRIQKRFCDAMDKVEKDFLSKLTDPDYLGKSLNNKYDSLERKIAIAQKNVCRNIYTDNLEIINRQSSAIHKQFTDQYNQIFPESKKAIEKAVEEAKHKTWIQRSEKNIEQLQSIASQQSSTPFTTTKAQAKNDSTITNPADKRVVSAAAAKHEKITERNKAALESFEKNVGTVTNTIETVKELQQNNAPKIVPEEQKQKSVAPVKQTQKVTQQTNSQQEVRSHAPPTNKSEAHRPISVKAGRWLGEKFGEFTKTLAGDIASAIKIAAIGAIDLAITVTKVIAQLAKSGETLAIENHEIEMQEMAASEAAPETTPPPVAQEDTGPSLYVKATRAIGGLIGWGVSTTLDGGMALGEFAIKAGIKAGKQVYHSITAPKQETTIEATSSKYAIAKEEKQNLGNHSPPAGKSAMTIAVGNSTKTDTPAENKTQDKTTIIIKTPGSSH